MGSDHVRIALIGAGRMGRVHLGALRSSREVELVGVVEPLGNVRAGLVAEGIRTYETVELLLDRDRPDAALIAAPSDRHLELVALLADARVPMLCEKPVGVRAEQADAATRAAADAGVLLQVGYWRRFVPELRDLRQRISSGQLGSICQLSCMQWDHDLPSERFRTHSGGISVDMGVHEFDQARWLVGEEFSWLAGAAAGPTSVARPAADPDCCVLLGQLSGGAAVTISLGRRFPHMDSCWLEIWGTDGYARVPFMWDTAGDQLYRACMVEQVEAFARAVRGERCAGAEGPDAVAALNVAALAAEALGAAAGRANHGV